MSACVTLPSPVRSGNFFEAVPPIFIPIALRPPRAPPLDAILDFIMPPPIFLTGFASSVVYFLPFQVNVLGPPFNALSLWNLKASLNGTPPLLTPTLYFLSPVGAGVVLVVFALGAGVLGAGVLEAGAWAVVAGFLAAGLVAAGAALRLAICSSFCFFKRAARSSPCFLRSARTFAAFLFRISCSFFRFSSAARFLPSASRCLRISIPLRLRLERP